MASSAQQPLHSSKRTEPDVSLAYVICTSPRSGSTLLCEGLGDTGRAGRPAEYFDDRPDVADHWIARLTLGTSAPYADQVVGATRSSNGVFGTKLHWTSRLAMRRAFLATVVVDQDRRRSLDDLLHLRFGAVRYIWLRRRNKVAQGISHYRAARTGLWERRIGAGADERRGVAGPPIDFNFRFIDHCVTWALRYDVEWEEYFLRHSLEPMLIFYEDLIDAYDASLRRILAFIGAPHRDLPELRPHLERLADAESLAWEQQYRHTHAAWGDSCEGHLAVPFSDAVDDDGLLMP
jgi:LPS sulfotransferase NodH